MGLNMKIGLVPRKKAQDEQRRKGYVLTHMSTRTRRPVADYGVVGDEEPFRDTASEDAAPKRSEQRRRERQHPNDSYLGKSVRWL
jgi:hypothetical protein